MYCLLRSVFRNIEREAREKIRERKIKHEIICDFSPSLMHKCFVYETNDKQTIIPETGEKTSLRALTAQVWNLNRKFWNTYKYSLVMFSYKYRAVERGAAGGLLVLND